MSLSTLVGYLTRHCIQKPGGSFILPKILSSEFCILCGNGCKCLGPSCKGPRPPTDHSQHMREMVRASSVTIPGLVGGPPSSVLTTPTQTVSKKIPISAISLKSPIFRWQCQNTNINLTVEATKDSSKRLKKKSNFQVKKSWYETLNSNTKKQLLSVLLKSSLNISTGKTKKEKKSSNPAKLDSGLRKLGIFEQPCIKKPYCSSSSLSKASNSPHCFLSSSFYSNGSISSSDMSSSAHTSPVSHLSNPCTPSNHQLII